MTTVTYTAKRNIVTVDFGVSGTDISADDADNSFNSSTTDLSGLNEDEWIEVVGSSSNDGWHQVSSDSTSTKIIVTSTLTTEAAGDNIAIDGYLHGKGEDYSLDFDSSQINPSSQAAVDESKSMNGTIEALFHRETFYWDITAIRIEQADKKLWDEFFSSVRARERFTFDAYGTIAAPDNTQSASLDDSPKYNRVGNKDMWDVKFKVRIQ